MSKNGTIKIFDPKERPFGWLSNNYVEFLRVDGVLWKSPTNFIYAHLLKTPGYRNSLRLVQPKKVKEFFTDYYNREVNDQIRKALEKAMTVKFNNEELAEQLVSTGTSPIYYVSSNTLLGTGVDNNGANLLGKYLMQIRHNLKVSYRRQKEEKAYKDRETAIYESYILERALINLIRQGNDLSEFIGMSNNEIFDKIGRLELMKKAPNKEMILDIFNKNMLDPIIELSIDNPNTMVQAIRKKEMRSLQLRQLRKRRSLIFDMYAEYVIQKEYSDLAADKYDTAKKQQFDSLGVQQKSDLENRLSVLFETGMLSSKLSDNIDQQLAFIIVPSEQEVEEAERVNLYFDEKEVIDENPYIPESGEPVLVYPMPIESNDQSQKNFNLSPLSYNGMLFIDGKKYPTVSHYILTSLFTLLSSVKTVNNAYPYLLANPKVPVENVESFLSPDSITSKYNQERDIDYANTLRKNTQIILNKKFEDRGLQDLLLITDKSNLVWNDFSDDILGVGEKGIRGENFVGKYLMELRNNENENRRNETIQTLTEVDIDRVVNSDAFMKEWIKMRIKDMCSSVMLMKEYLFNKDQIDKDIDPMFVTTVLDKVYQPCSSLYVMTNQVNIEAPQYISNMITLCKGFADANSEVIDLIWKRVAVMIYVLIKYLEVSTLKNIRAVIAKVELMVSAKTDCIQLISNDEDNCIFSAIVNILRGIVEFNKQYSYSTDLNEIDIKAAISLIIKKEINDQSCELKTNEDEPEDIIPEAQEFMIPEKDEQRLITETYYDQITDENGYSPDYNMILLTTKNIEEVKDNFKFSKDLENAIKVVKNCPMSRRVKQNRINFFATQR